MPRFADLALPVALVLLQLIWSGIFQHLPWSGEAPSNPPEQTGLKPPAATPKDRKGSGNQVEVVNAVKWLSSDGTSAPTAPGVGTEMPLFPLGGRFYPLHSRSKLTIFEPRYRKLYQELLASNSESSEFAVTLELETGELAAFGVIFRIDEVKDIAEETRNQVKYIANHTVMRRVQIRELVNPEATGDEMRYLKAVVVPVEDDADSNEDFSELEADTIESFKDLISLYPNFKFPDFDLKEINASRQNGGLWHFASLWINGYWANRALLTQQQILSQIQQIADPRDSEIGALEQLLDTEVRRVQREAVTMSQLLLQSRSHQERLKLLRSAIKMERLFAAADDPEHQGVAFVGWKFRDLEANRFQQTTCAWG